MSEGPGTTAAEPGLPADALASEAAVPPPARMERAAGGFMRHAASVGTAALAVQVIGVVSTPLVSRLFSPEAFGIAGIFGSITGIAAMVGCLRYDAAILLPREDEDAASLVGLSSLIAVAMTVLVGVVCWFGGRPLLATMHADSLFADAWIIPLGQFLMVAALPLTAWNQRLRNFDRLTGVRITSSLANTIGTLATGAAGLGLGIHLIYARVFSGFLLAPLLMLALGWSSDLRYIVRNCTWQRLRAVAIRYRGFPRLNTLASLLDILGREAPGLVLAGYFGPAVAGYYALSRRLLYIPGTFVAGAISEVLFERAAASRSEGGDLGPLVLSVCKRLVAVGLMPIVAIALIGPLVFEVVFGAKWAEAGSYTMLLAPQVFAMFFSSPITVLFPVLELHRFNLISEVLLFLAFVGTIVVGALVWGDVKSTLLLYSVTSSLAILWRLSHLLKAAGASVVPVLRHIALHLSFLAPAIAAGVLTRHVWGLPVVVSVCAVLLAMVPYPFLMLRVDKELDVATRLVLRKVVSRLRRSPT
ncbi:MAG: lipopolysaccharide biosynthesis protein [Myxococcota bacterium]